MGLGAAADLSQRDINMMRELYKLPHDAKVDRDGTWRVVA